MEVFLDSSVIIAALLSPEGGSAKILTLCETYVLHGFISKDVIQEITEVLKRKFPQVAPQFKKLLAMTHITIIHKIKPVLLKTASKLVKYHADAKILAAAKQVTGAILITLDLRHFINDPAIALKAGISIMTPGDFLKRFIRTVN